MMFAARQRAAGAARQLQRSARAYATESHAHAKPAEVTESFGLGSKLTIGALFGGVLVYQLAPGQDKETSSITRMISNWTSRAEDWEEINSRHTKAAEQAGYDRNLFQHAGPSHRHVNITYPEAFQSHAPRNISAGSLINLDHVVEHYKQEHIKAEQQKGTKLAEKSQ